LLGHSWRVVLMLSILAMLAFFTTDRLYPTLARAFGTRAPLASPVSLPVLLFMVSAFGVLATP
jgi:STE24 endopeptidase